MTGQVGVDATSADRPPRWQSVIPRQLVLVGAVAVAVVALVPPLGALAGRHVAFESLQFALLGYVVPPLLALGLPAALRARLSAPRFPGRAWVSFVAFEGVAILWRLKPAVDALHSSPGLVVLEFVMLVVTGLAFWLELTDSSLATASTPGPAKMAMAAVAMWSIWIVAYMLGFSKNAWYPSFHHVAGHGLSLQADQEIACWILWAVPGFAFVPVLFTRLIGWLRSEEEPESELRAFRPATRL